MAALRSISQVAGELGVTTRTLRYYEQLGLLTPAPRAGRGPRRYDAEAGERAALIRRMQAAGLSLATIRLVLELRAEVAQLDARGDARERAGRYVAAVRARHAEVAARVRALEGELAQARALEEGLARDVAICEAHLARQSPATGRAGAADTGMGATGEVSMAR